jgi:hypothetical protein
VAELSRCNNLKRKEGNAMGKKLNAILLLILSILLSLGAGCTDSGRYAVSGKASTLGLGGEFTTVVTSNINARVGINALNIDFDDEEIEGVEFDVGIDLSSYSALLDWYVFNGSFRLSGGIISMDNKVDLEARPTENIEIGDVDFTPDEVGYLYGSIENDEVVPYVGIGWGNPLTADRRWGFTCDFGVAFTSSPDVTLTAIGGTNPSGLEEELAKQRNDIEDFFDKFKLYPIIALSFFYRF